MDGGEVLFSAVVGFTVVAATAAIHYLYPDALPAAAEAARKRTQSNTADIKAAINRAHGRMPSVDIRGITWPTNEQISPSKHSSASSPNQASTSPPPRPPPRRVNRSRTTSPSSSPPITSPTSSSIPSWVPGWSSSAPTSPKAAPAAASSETPAPRSLAKAASVLLSNALSRPSDARKFKAASLIQAHWKGIMERKRYKHHRMRYAVAREICETERSYVRSLERAITIEAALTELAMKNSSKAPLSLDDVSSMFGQGSLKVIKNYSKLLVEALDARLAQWNYHQTVGDVFTAKDILPFFRVYTVYIKQVQNGMDVVDKAEKRKAYRKWAEQNLQPGETIGSLQIIGVQRPPRYVLLLSELKKHTAEDHPDRENVEQALAAMKDLAILVDDTKAAHDRLTKMVDLQTKLSGYPGQLVQPSRRLLEQAQMHEKGGNRMSVFLFSDQLVLARPKFYGDSLKFERLVPLRPGVVVATGQAGAAHDTVASVSSAKPGKAAPDQIPPNALWVRWKDDPADSQAMGNSTPRGKTPQPKRLCLLTASAEDAEAWKTLLTSAIAEQTEVVNSRNRHKPKPPPRRQ